MKQSWQKFSAKIDALTLRERLVIFLLVAVVIITLVNLLVLDPLFTRQKRLSTEVKTGQTSIAEIQKQVRRLTEEKHDPDAADRARLQTLKQQFSTSQGKLLALQKGLVSPERMTALLEDILRRDSRLRLVSLKTLPVVSIDEFKAGEQAAPGTDTALNPTEKLVREKFGPVPTAAAGLAGQSGKTATPAARGKEKSPVYMHGVEIVVQGGYLDMLQYMQALEKMPWQLFWNKASLQVEEYPKATLNLTLYTLSLDRKWMNL